jgi:histone deacetylase complex subunit SAP18
LPANELQIYTWLDATLKELTRLITEVYPHTKAKGTQFSFAVVWPDPRSSGFRMKNIGVTTIGAKGSDDNATLESKKFHIGDYLDVSVLVGRSHPLGRDRDRGDQRDNRREIGGGGGGGGRDQRDDRRMRPYPNYR